MQVIIKTYMLTDYKKIESIDPQLFSKNHNLNKIKLHSRFYGIVLLVTNIDMKLNLFHN